MSNKKTTGHKVGDMLPLNTLPAGMQIKIRGKLKKLKVANHSDNFHIGKTATGFFKIQILYSKKRTGMNIFEQATSFRKIQDFSNAYLY